MAASGICMYHVYKPVLGSRYSGTVSLVIPCRKACLHVQLQIDDAILFIC